MDDRSVEVAGRLAWWRGRPWSFWLLPGLLVGVVALAPARGGGYQPGEVTTVLLAESLAHDADTTVGPDDEERLEAWRAAQPDLPAPRVAGGRYDSPVAAALVLVPAALIGGVRTMALWQALMLAAACLLAARTLSRRMGSGASVVVAVLVFGSVLFAYPFRLWPVSALVPLVIAASALAFGADLPRRGPLEELYRSGWEEHELVFAVRWAIVGILLGLVAAGELLAVPLVLSAAVAVPARRRAVGIPLLLGGAAVIVLAVAFGAGLPSLGSDLGAGLVGDEIQDFRLWGLQIGYLVVGRHGGALLWFLPLLLVAGCMGLGRGRWSILVGAGLVIAGALWFRPFDAAGYPEALGHGLLVLVYPTLWFLADREPPRLATSAVALAAAACLWPLWVAPWRTLVDDDGRSRVVPSYFAPWIPVETTWRGLPLGPEVRRDEATLRLVSGPAWAGERSGEIIVMGPGPVEVLVSAERPLGGLRFEGPEALGAEVEVVGGELAETLLRPDRSVGFLVRTDETKTFHPAPGVSGVAYFYRLCLEFPDARYRPNTVRLGTVIPRFEGESP